MRDTIDMARAIWESGTGIYEGPTIGQLKAFEALVRADEREEANRKANASWTLMCEKMVQAEREACAKVCDARYMGDNNREDMEAKRCAAAIRARGETK